MKEAEAQAKIKDLDDRIDAAIRAIKKKIADPATPESERRQLQYRLDSIKQECRTQIALMRDHRPNGNGGHP